MFRCSASRRYHMRRGSLMSTPEGLPSRLPGPAMRAPPLGTLVVDCLDLAVIEQLVAIARSGTREVLTHQPLGVLGVVLVVGKLARLDLAGGQGAIRARDRAVIVEVANREKLASRMYPHKAVLLIAHRFILSSSAVGSRLGYGLHFSGMLASTRCDPQQPLRLGPFLLDPPTGIVRCFEVTHQQIKLCFVLGLISKASNSYQCLAFDLLSKLLALVLWGNHRLVSSSAVVS